MGKRQDGLVHMELCKNFSQGLLKMKILVNHPLWSCCIPRGLGWSAHVKHTFSPHGQCTAQSCNVSNPLISVRGSRAGWHRGHLFTSGAVLLVQEQQDLCQAALVTHTPLIAPAKGRNCPPVDQPNTKGAKLDANLTWLVAC